MAESLRRIIVTAIALERYRGRHGAYPNELASLAPEFLKTVPLDFMDGQPLRYRLARDGHFLLYSVGLDCVDNAGKVHRSWRDEGFKWPPPEEDPDSEFDLVWPLPAGDDARQEEKEVQAAAEKRRVEIEVAEQKHYLTEISVREWRESPARQSRVGKILGARWTMPDEEPTWNGQTLVTAIGNPSALGTNQLSLLALLTPRQIITGKEPEDITFEFPIRYDAVTNSIMFVVVDADPEEEMKIDSGGKVYGRERAPNGDCLVVWHAIYDPPGRHAVQLYLALLDDRVRLYVNGPPISVTTSNLCQFSLDCVNYDPNIGAIFHARLPENNGRYTIDCVTTNGEPLTTLSGSTTTGEFREVWNLVDGHGHRLDGEPFNSVVHITLPDSGRTQTLRGP